MWDAPIDAKLFALDVPHGYQQGNIITLPRPTESAKPPTPSPVTRQQLAEGILSRDRGPSRIVWGPQRTTITAIMRDPESVPALGRKFNELRQWDVATGQLT